MKTLSLMLLSALPFFATAVEPVENDDFDPDEIVLPGKGSVAIVSAVDEAYFPEIADAAKQFENTVYVTTVATSVQGFSMADAREIASKQNANIAVFVVDDVSLPTEFVSMTDRWGLVNIARLKDGAPDDDAFKTRLRRLIMRQAGFLAGATIPRSPTCLMCGVAGVADIDAIEMDTISLDLLFNISRFESKSGISPGHKTGYRSACERGIAPPPVTEYQKMVWEEFHSLPTKPIKIKFDKNVGR